MYHFDMDIESVNVTLPTIEELQGHTFLASDFALANGVKFNTIKQDGQTLNCARVASCTVYKEEKAGVPVIDPEPTVVNYFVQSKSTEMLDGQVIEDKWPDSAGDHSLGFAPKIVNPEALDMTIENGVIKIGDQIPTWPQSFVGNELNAQLEAMLAQNQLVETGGVTTDSSSRNYSRGRYDEQHNEKPHPKTHKKYRFGDAEYVRMEWVQARTSDNFCDEKVAYFNDGTQVENQTCWFKCEPYQAFQGQDGSIICATALVPGKVDMHNTFQTKMQNYFGNEMVQNRIERGENVNNLKISNSFAAGQFLNRPFLREMLQSVGLNLDQLREQQRNAGQEM